MPTRTLVAKTFHQGMVIPSALMTTMQPSLLIILLEMQTIESSMFGVGN
jgi:hypothetical protein